MNKITKLLKGKQSGQALVLALALLGLGSLMIAPMLSFMGTGLNAGVIAEDKTDELYACDAGVQDAIWLINHLGEPSAIPYTELDGLDDDTGESIEEYYDYASEGRPLPHVNGEDVRVKITLLYMIEGFGIYQVHSWVGSGSFNDADTRIDAIITTTWLDFGDITEYVVTSQGEFEELGVGGYVHPDEGEPGYDEHGPQDYYDGAWPTPADMIAWYSRDVDKDNPLYPLGELELTDPNTTIGPVYIDNDFYVHNSNSNPNAVLTLGGTLYITGKTEFGGNRDFTIDMNGQTIFIESNLISGAGPALLIDKNVTVTGSGCIIAIGDIKFQPHMESDENDYILILAVGDPFADPPIVSQTWMQPNGSFYGTLAGNIVTTQQGNADINWAEPPDVEPPPDGDGNPDINFPGGSGGGGMIWGIQTWLYNETYEIP